MAGDAPELKLFLNQSEEQQVYYPGQSVSGSLELVVRESKWYQYVVIGLQGKGEVQFRQTHTEGTGNNQRTYSTTHSSNETYVDLVEIVWGNKEAPQPTRLDPGTFNFPFQFTIPPNCPPTFETDIGHISYQVYGVISSQVKEYKIETPLILNRVIDLNQQPNLLQPVEQSTVKDITTCCCCKSAEVQITIRIPKTGFCVNLDRIPVTFECRNGSSREISIRAELALGAEYSARGNTKQTYETIGNFACKIRPSQNETKSVDFDIPPTAQMAFTSRIINVGHCVNVWVNHSLDFEFEFLSENSIPPVSVPITIGNVPFRDPQTAVAEPAQLVPPPPAQCLPPTNGPGYPAPLGPAVAPPEGPVLATPEPSAVQAATPPEIKSQPSPLYGLVTTI